MTSLEAVEMHMAQERRERRERIATAALQGILANSEGDSDPARHAVEWADALIAELDKLVEPRPAGGEAEAVRLLARLLPHIGDGARMEDIERASELVREADGGAR